MNCLNPRKSIRKCSRETEISKSNVHRILKQDNWISYIPSLFLSINEDDPDRRKEFCELYFSKFEEAANFFR